VTISSLACWNRPGLLTSTLHDGWKDEKVDGWKDEKVDGWKACMISHLHRMIIGRNYYSCKNKVSKTKSAKPSKQNQKSKNMSA
jgi:hypothetical protein